MKMTPGAARTLAALMTAAPGVAQQGSRAPTQLAPDQWAEAPVTQAQRDDSAPFQRDLTPPPRRDRLFPSYVPRLIWGDPAERDYARESRNQRRVRRCGWRVSAAACATDPAPRFRRTRRAG